MATLPVGVDVVEAEGEEVVAMVDGVVVDVVAALATALAMLNCGVKLTWV